MRKKKISIMKKCSLAFSIVVSLSISAVFTINNNRIVYASQEYPDEILLGTFWESDENNTDTCYWSTDGVNFYELSEAYTDATPDSSETSWIPNTPYNVSTLHDPSIIYKDNYFWMLSGFSLTDNALGRRYVPMMGYSSDLVNWSYPNSGSSVNVGVTEAPPGQEKYGQEWDAVAPDFMVDDDGTVWITVCMGYYAQFHATDGNSQNDIMKPYLIKASNLSVPEDANTITNKGAPPVVTYSDAVPINLPQYNNDIEINNRIDASIYKEGDYYYYLVKKEGVTVEIWRTKNFSLDAVQNENNWELVTDDAVTGYEGPSLTKFKGEYFLYTDKLKDYPPDDYDGTTGVYVSRASTATTGKLDKYTGWLESNQTKIVAHGADGSIKNTRHGTVITVTDSEAIKVIWKLRAKTRYSSVMDTIAKKVDMGWYIKESFKAPRYGCKRIRYWYENDVRQGLVNRGKEIYDPYSDGWYWLDSINDGAMASDKDVYLPIDKVAYNNDAQAYGMDPSKWKWVRYDIDGKMVHGEDHRAIKGASDDTPWGYWYFHDITGAMLYGNQTITTGGVTKKVYYDDVTGIMLYGEHIMNGYLYYFDKYDGTAIDGWYPSEDGTLYWYESGQRQGYKVNDSAYRGKEIYDPYTGYWYWLDNVQKGAFAKSKDVYQESSGGKWVRYDEYGHMIKGWSTNSAGTYYFDLITGAMSKGYTEIDGVGHYFNEITGIMEW